MSTVSLAHLRKVYANGFHAVEGIDLDIADGEFIVLVGPSGCGKSTLLRMIAGLEPVTAGEIRIDDRRVNTMEPGERDIAMVFQNYALYPHMSVFRNMAYGLRNRGMPKNEIERKVGDTARMLELEALLERRPAQLSGGQRQRVAMGRAIVRDPRVFLFDEPLSNLDAKLRVQMRLEVKRLQRHLGTTSVYVTHDQVEAMTMADRLVVLNDGHVEQIGTPIDVYERPASQFVGAFIGSPPMNFIPVNGADGRIRLTPDGPVLFGAESIAAPSSLLGIRPERLIACEPGEADCALSIDIVESLGADTLVHARWPMDGETSIVVRLPGHQHLNAGEALPVRLDRDALHLFGQADGQRLA